MKTRKKVKAIELIKEGQISIKEIGKKLKIHPMTLYRWRKENKNVPIINSAQTNVQKKMMLLGELKYRLSQMRKEIDNLIETIK